MFFFRPKSLSPWMCYIRNGRGSLSRPSADLNQNNAYHASKVFLRYGLKALCFVDQWQNPRFRSFTLSATCRETVYMLPSCEQFETHMQFFFAFYTKSNNQFWSFGKHSSLAPWLLKETPTSTAFMHYSLSHALRIWRHTLSFCGISHSKYEFHAWSLW
jgi:hypothetical protein